jgi:hypothetical protein
MTRNHRFFDLLAGGIATAVILQTGVGHAGTFSGKAVDLEQAPIRDLEVLVLAPQGTVVASTEGRGGAFEVPMKADDTVRFDHVVRLRFEALGRQTVTLERIFGNSDQSISVVMPVAAAAAPTMAPGIPQYVPPCGCCAPTAAQAPSSNPFQLSDTVHVGVDETKLMRAKKTYAILPQGTQLTVINVNGEWVGVRPMLDGRYTSGWVYWKALLPAGR